MFSIIIYPIMPLKKATKKCACPKRPAKKAAPKKAPKKAAAKKPAAKKGGSLKSAFGQFSDGFNKGFSLVAKPFELASKFI